MINKIKIKCSNINCSKELERWPFQLKRRCFCGRACFLATIITKKIVRCASCDAELIRKASRAKKGLNFCNQKCQGKYEFTRELKPCENCQKLILRAPSHSKIKDKGLFYASGV